MMHKPQAARERFAGRTDFPPASEPVPGCDQPRYAIAWQSADGTKVRSNYWYSREQAERIRDDKLAIGRLLATYTLYVGGPV